MSLTPVQQRLVEASQVEEAIRLSRASLPGDPSKVPKEDQCIVQAWDKARAEMRAACTAYVGDGEVDSP